MIVSGLAKQVGPEYTIVVLMNSGIQKVYFSFRNFCCEFDSLVDVIRMC